MNRVGVTGAWGYTEYNLYPDNSKYPWLRRVTLFSFSQGGRDQFAGGNEFIEVAGTRINFSRQGFLRVDGIWGFEHWAGLRFKRGRPRAFGNGNSIAGSPWTAASQRGWQCSTTRRLRSRAARSITTRA